MTFEEFEYFKRLKLSEFKKLSDNIRSILDKVPKCLKCGVCMPSLYYRYSIYNDLCSGCYDFICK